MAKARIERHPAVIAEDLPAIYDYIAKNSLTAAQRVLDAVDSTFNIISNERQSGVIYRTRHQRLQGLRMIPVKGFSNYLIFYRAHEDAIRILYVVHGARHLLRLFRREART